MPQEVGDALDGCIPSRWRCRHVYSEKFQVRSEDMIFSNPSSFLLGVLQIRSISSLEIQSTWHA
jgi:hypothetical protein